MTTRRKQSTFIRCLLGSNLIMHALGCLSLVLQQLDDITNICFTHGISSETTDPVFHKCPGQASPHVCTRIQLAQQLMLYTNIQVANSSFDWTITELSQLYNNLGLISNHPKAAPSILPDISHSWFLFSAANIPTSIATSSFFPLYFYDS